MKEGSRNPAVWLCKANVTDAPPVSPYPPPPPLLWSYISRPAIWLAWQIMVREGSWSTRSSRGHPWVTGAALVRQRLMQLTVDPYLYKLRLSLYFCYECHSARTTRPWLFCHWIRRKKDVMFVTAFGATYLIFFRLCLCARGEWSWGFCEMLLHLRSYSKSFQPSHFKFLAPY